MKQIFFFLMLLGVQLSFGQSFEQKFVTEDIDNFWNAYEKIRNTQDSVQQYKLLHENYLDKASEGLKSLIIVRSYTDKEFIDAINKYPEFWASIKPNTFISSEVKAEIEADILRLKQLYAGLKPSTIYFTVGAFRTNGTIEKNKVLIGSEMSLADSLTIVDELPGWRQVFYKEYNPKKNLALLCTHEYVHTQQKAMVENLLSMCLYEGIAEFISCKVTGKKSSVPAIEYGKANKVIVVDRFINDLFIMSNNYNWLWGENRNELKVRDLGYYIGFEIAEKYFNASTDKKKAIVELIKLDYKDEKEVERIVNSTRFLPKTLSQLNKEYDAKRPKVISIEPFKNGNKKVKPGLTKISITFSEPLSGRNTGIDFGPLGENFCPKISRDRTWSGDNKTWTFEADLLPNKRYQILISNNFRTKEGIRLKPYLIDISTTN